MKILIERSEKMTRKDYILMAKYLSAGVNTIDKDNGVNFSVEWKAGFGHAVEMLCLALAEDNPKSAEKGAYGFDERKFREAVCKEED